MKNSQEHDISYDDEWRGVDWFDIGTSMKQAEQKYLILQKIITSAH
jgi:hypothetical protein